MGPRPSWSIPSPYTIIRPSIDVLFVVDLKEELILALVRRSDKDFPIKLGMLDLYDDFWLIMTAFQLSLDCLVVNLF